MPLLSAHELALAHVTHPSLEYLLVAAVAGGGSLLATPIARGIAVKWDAIARPRERDVHSVAIPRLGGTAMFAGLCLALFTAGQLPTLRAAFGDGTGPEMPWIVVAAGLICLIGAIDDRFELDSLTKLAGQVLATGIMVTLGGVQLTEVYLPFGDAGTFVLGQDLGIPVTIAFTVLTINAMNFIDGLDGLAAGVTVIASCAFFAFSYHLVQRNWLDVAATPTLLTAALAGTCLGFLPHNFFPARIFMGDSGSMLVGMMLAAAAVTATTNADPQGFDGALGSLPLFLPLLIPLAVLAIPFVDLLLAVVRRVSSGHSPFLADKRHLHHRLLELGHSHRRAVLLLYYWSALLGFGGTAFSIFNGAWVLVLMISAAVVGVLLLVVPTVQARRRKARAVPAKVAGNVGTSRPVPAPISTTAPRTTAPTTTAPTPTATTTTATAPVTSPGPPFVNGTSVSPAPPPMHTPTATPTQAAPPASRRAV